MGIWSLTCQATGSLRRTARPAPYLLLRDVAWAPRIGQVLCRACTFRTQTTLDGQPSPGSAARKLVLPAAKTAGIPCYSFSTWQLDFARSITFANSEALTGVWSQANGSHGSNLVPAGTVYDQKAPTERARALFDDQFAISSTSDANNTVQTPEATSACPNNTASVTHAPASGVATTPLAGKSTSKPDRVLQYLHSTLKNGNASLSTIIDATKSLRSNQVQPAHIHAIAQAALQVIQTSSLGKSDAAMAWTGAGQAFVNIKEHSTLHGVDGSRVTVPADMQQQYIKLVLQITNLISERARSDLWDIKLAVARQTLADEFYNHAGHHTSIPPGAMMTNQAAKRYAALQFAETCCEYMAATAPLVALLPGRAKKRGALHMFRSWISCALQELSAPGSTTEFRPNQDIMNAIMMSDGPSAKALKGEQLISASAHRRMLAQERPTKGKSAVGASRQQGQSCSKGRYTLEEFGPEQQHGLNEAAETVYEALDTTSSAVLVAYLASPERLVKLLARLTEVGVREAAICHRLGDLLTPLVQASLSPRHRTSISTNSHPSDFHNSAFVPPQLQLTPSQMVSVATSLGTAGYHHKPFFQAMSAAMLTSACRHEQSGRPGVDALTSTELAALMAACASVNHQEVELMSSCCSLASHWLQHKTSPSLISLLSGGQSIPTPHPLQPFSLQQLSSIADAVVCTCTHTLPVGSVLLSAICQEASAQLYASMQQSQQQQHQNSDWASTCTTTNASATFSLATSSAVVHLCHALYQAGYASTLLLDTAVTLLLPHLDQLPAQALMQLLEIHTPNVTPTNSHSCFSLQHIQPTKVHRALQHRQQLLTQLATSLIPHVQQLNASSLAFITQRLSASRIIAPSLLEAVSNRILLLLGSSMVDHVTCSICAPVTVEALPAIPAAISVVIAQAAQGYRNETLLSRLAHVLRSLSITTYSSSNSYTSHGRMHQQATRGMITNVLEPAQLIGLAASYAHLSAHAPELLHMALACIDFKKASSRGPDDPLIDPSHAVWNHSGNILPLGSSEHSEQRQQIASDTLIVPTFSQLVELLWATLLMPHATQLQPCCQEEQYAQGGNGSNHQRSTATSKTARSGTEGQTLQPHSSMSSSPNVKGQVQEQDTFITAVKLHTAIQQLKIQDVFDPTVILLAKAHMIFVAHASNRSGELNSLHTGPAAAGFVNSLRYAWDQHLRHVQHHKQQIMHQQEPTDTGLHYNKQAAALTAEVMQDQLSQSLKDASNAMHTSFNTASKGRADTQESRQFLDLAHACRRMLLQVDGFMLPIEMAVEFGGQMVALSCHGKDHYCIMSNQHQGKSTSTDQDGEASIDMEEVSASHDTIAAGPGQQTNMSLSGQQQAKPLLLSHGIWQEAILSQLGWSIIQIPYWEWETVVRHTTSKLSQTNSQLQGPSAPQTSKRLSETAAAPASVWQQARSQAKKGSSQSAVLDPIVSPLIRPGSRRNSQDEHVTDNVAANAAAQYIASRLSTLQALSKS